MHSFKRPIVQLFLSIFSLFALRLGHLRCHSGPELLLSLSLLGVAPPLSDLVREASGAPSGTAHEEYSLQVSLFLLFPFFP